MVYRKGGVPLLELSGVSSDHDEHLVHRVADSVWMPGRGSAALLPADDEVAEGQDLPATAGLPQLKF